MAPDKHSPTRYAKISIIAAVFTIAFKLLAYYLTNSVGLLSDAIESFVNLATAFIALWALIVAAQPPSAKHPYGRAKAEYFSSGFEGSMIVIAAIGISYEAVTRFLHPEPITQIWVGAVWSGAASIINFFVARVLLKASVMHRSITLEADAKHLLTDVWTSIGVLIGVLLVAITGWQWLDPAIALIVAVQIIRTGIGLIAQSASSLLDQSVDSVTEAAINKVLEEHRSAGVDFHEMKTRQAGRRVFVRLHMVVPPRWTVRIAHELAETVERCIMEALPSYQTNVITHIEPNDDPRAYSDHTQG